MRLRVVECGNMLSGPLLGCHLAHCGARVVSVVRPLDTRGAREERARMPRGFWALRQGKETVELDARRERERALALVREADVLIQNFAPGCARAASTARPVPSAGWRTSCRWRPSGAR